jgi:hypothetical protein
MLDIWYLRTVNRGTIENIAERWVKSNILDLSTDTSYCTTAHDAAVKVLSESHCLTRNLPLSASSISFPPTLHWSVLQGCDVAHQLWSSRSTWRPLERNRKNFHEANRGRSLSSPHTARLLHVSRGGERGKVIELSSKTCIAPTGRASVS